MHILTNYDCELRVHVFQSDAIALGAGARCDVPRDVQRDARRLRLEARHLSRHAGPEYVAEAERSDADIRRAARVCRVGRRQDARCFDACGSGRLHRTGLESTRHAAEELPLTH